MDGVIRTRVGYSGGATPRPTYHNLGDHTETVQIDYDPARLSYEKLLAVFWSSHQPGDAPWSRQYKAVIFYHNEEQQRLALKTKAALAAKLGRPVFTEVLPAGEFYLAEDYHQKYYLQQVPELWGEVRASYPAGRAWIDSTAAARINGYLAGFGDPARLEQMGDLLGLSPQGRARLAARVQAASRSGPKELCPVN